MLTTTAVCLTAVVVWRELAPRPTGRDTSAPRQVAWWEQARAVGLEIGDSTAALKIVEFVDLECPACRQYHESEFARFVAENADRAYSHVVVHLPLRGHRFAVAAAVAAECAAEQGVLRAFVDVALMRQREFGIASWSELGSDAGVPDLPGFDACLSEPRVRERVDAARNQALAWGINATPTFVVNGFLLGVPPSASRLSRWLGESKRGRLSLAEGTE
ncbi:MAG: thioredoxin domain-containing protein [Gemmatimonadaceae bacterium]|nr:thioredoxin domain-containing protein [Gemmatimonadaceae bacterium]